MERESSWGTRSASPVRGWTGQPITGGSAPGGRFRNGSALLQRLPPRAIRLVPTHRLRQTPLEGDLVPPAELLAQLSRVEQITAVVPRPVRDDRLQRGGLSRELEHRVGDLLD